MHNKQSTPVTVLFDRTVKNGHEEEFDTWYTELIRLSKQHQGHISTQVIKRDKHYITLQQFDSEKNLQAWLNSETRLEQINKLTDLTTSAPEPITLDGLEPWFDLPNQPVTKHIPKWKMALLTFVSIWIIVAILNVILIPYIAHWPLLLRAAAVPLIIVPLLTYIIMPQLTRRLKDWLHR